MYPPRPAWGFIFHLIWYLRLTKMCSESILFVSRGVPVSAVMWTETRACRKLKDAIHEFIKHIYSLLFHRFIQLFYFFSNVSVGINTCRHNMTNVPSSSSSSSSSYYYYYYYYYLLLFFFSSGTTSQDETWSPKWASATALFTTH